MGRRVADHNKQINDIQLSKDMNLLATASKDNTAKVCVVFDIGILIGRGPLIEFTK